jgi:hypothetical protein
MKSYAHTQQDAAVIDIFGPEYKGFFLDIGANDGMWVSNTYALEKDYGWNGICIESDDQLHNKLKANRKCKCFHNLVTSSDGPGHNITLKTLFRREKNVPKVIDYMSLDVDGHEMHILNNFPWDDITIKFATIEHDLYSGHKEAHKNDIFALMSSKGYIKVLDNHGPPGYPYEDWYIHSSFSLDSSILNKYKVAIDFFPDANNSYLNI